MFVFQVFQLIVLQIFILLVFFFTQDGSGTRRVVQVLTQLGVTMVSEDPETYDIHGDLMGGWPPVVAPVLQVGGLH